MAARCPGHDFREFARSTEGEVAILMGCIHCPATKIDRPARKR